MIEIYKRTELDRLMKTYGLHFSKGLGQNFLTDKNLLEKIVDGAGLTQDDHVVEIGAGLGGLTVLLAHAAGRVTAIEIDRRLIPALREATEGLPNVELVNEDFLKYEWSRGDGANGQSETNPQKFKIVGNLPYNITTPVIAKLFEAGSGGAGPDSVRPDGASLDNASRDNPGPDSLLTAPGCAGPGSLRPAPFECAVFMIQKEVAERLLSPPGKKAYGAISVLVQYHTEAEMLFHVSREVFIPKPKVDSAVIRLRPKDLSGDDPAVAALMFRLVRAGFDQRRKTLRNSLSAAGFPEETLLAALEKAGVDPVRRAETLSPRDFYRVASQLA